MPLRYWLFVILTLALATAVSMATYRSALLLRRWQPDQNLLLLLSENILRLFLIAVCVGLGWLSGLPAQQLDWSVEGWQSAASQGLVWGGLMALGFFLATGWVVKRTGERFYSTVVIDAVVPRTGGELFWTAVAMLGVVAAEELLFRSLLVGGMQPIAPAFLLVILTSVLFGVLHLPQGTWGVSGATLAGGLLGALFLLSGSIIAVGIAHYVTNMTQITIAMRRRSQLDEDKHLTLDR